jgi:hypothetical protein
VNEDYSRESSVTSMLKELKWPTLQQGRTNAKMVMMYRIVHHHLMAIPSQMYLTPATTRTTRGHDQKVQYHSPEYRVIKTHTSLQQSEHGITCQQC